jgi:hypothetical protein
MEPVGVAAKRLHKKYGSPVGELMLVHHCIDCERISLNRLAADDDPETVLAVFAASRNLDACDRSRLAEEGITLLSPTDAALVHLRLYGASAPFLSQ